MLSQAIDIVSFLGIYVQNTQKYMVLEFCPKGSVDTILKRVQLDHEIGADLNLGRRLADL